MSLCYLCSKQILIHERYIDEFIAKNLHSKRNKKYMIILFRLAPFLFKKIDLSNTVLKNIHTSYCTDDSYGFIYNGYFHQPHLTISDYEVCDNCTHYICPMHLKFNPMNYRRCNYCWKTWCICLNCMYTSTEINLCNKLHKNLIQEVLPDTQEYDSDDNDDFSIFDLILDYGKKDKDEDEEQEEEQDEELKYKDLKVEDEY